METSSTQLEDNICCFPSYREYRRAYEKAWRKRNKALVSKYGQSYYNKNREIILKRTSDNAKKNRERVRRAAEKWRLKNKDRVANYARNRRRSNPGHVLHSRMSTSIRSAIGGNKGRVGWQQLVGYTTERLKAHLEARFTDGMSWDALCRGEIHIDHVKPRCLFNFESPSDPEFLECWALSNLQPLWAKDNLRKSDKFAG